MSYCSNCGSEINDKQAVCLKCGCAVGGYSMKADLSSGRRNKWIAVLLAFLLGGVGAHKFYLGKIGWGIVYLLFFWTGIPSIIAFIEMIIYLTMSDEAFSAKYN